MSETAKIRDRAMRFCQGYGIDLGHGGDKITPMAIGFDLPQPYTSVGTDKSDMAGDARALPFPNETFRYVYSSHLLEDFEDTHAVLKEWWRTLKVGGILILYLPHEMRYREFCKKHGGYNLAHKISIMSLEYILSVLNSNYYQHEVVDSEEDHGEYCFYLAVRKIGKEPQKETSGLHAGDIGDIIYAIPIMQKLNMTKLYISLDWEYNGSGTKFDGKAARFLAPLLKFLGIDTVIWDGREQYDYNMNVFRIETEDLTCSHLGLAQARAMKVDVDMSAKYILVPPKSITDEPHVVVSRSQRYHNNYFNWQYLLHNVKNICFVGLEDEYYDFQSDMCRKIEYYHCADALDMAQVIMGGNVFVGNQSAPYALAEGLKKNRIQEVCGGVPNALPQSKNGIPVLSQNQLPRARNLIHKWLTNPLMED